MAILKIRDSNGNVQEILAIRGEKGADGTVAFEDLTPEQKESLKGDKGDAFTYEDFTQEQLEALDHTFIVNCDNYAGNVDKTYAEIKVAVDSGKHVVCCIKNSQHDSSTEYFRSFLPLSRCDNSIVCFSATYFNETETVLEYVNIDSNNVLTLGQKTLGVELPSAEGVEY